MAALMHLKIFIFLFLSFHWFAKPIEETGQKNPFPSSISFNKVRPLSLDEIVSKDAESDSCSIPFTRAGNLILIKAKADTTEGNFILDTGAPNLVLNITYFRDYPSTTTVDAEQTGITGSTPMVVKTSVKKFLLGSQTYSVVEADLVNLGAIENSKGVKILGLLGMELFSKCEMIIDYEKSILYLHWINRKEAATYKHDLLKDTSSYRTFPIELTDNRIIAATEIGGKKLKLIIDCAAESNILDSRLPNKIFENVVITGRVKLTGVGNKKVDALYGEMKGLKIGNNEIGNLPVLITNLENTCFAYNGCIDGILGFDFLSLHKIGF
ncbi:MAG TPA: pepsin/retropepsin-like aspartic protease family protein, partial [Chitinophagaceae bacterium]|nr:pepsin/retropepsin-like aspartic protease family protein [Chitinophagaceae bacterium]